MMMDERRILMPTVSTKISSSSSPPPPPMAPPNQNNAPVPLRCPRCDSSNTKFCYYNNYSLTQPRHFCKACKRYWTRGGTLRNVPVGGGCRKNKRIKKSAAPASAVAVAAADPAKSSSLFSSSDNHSFNSFLLGLPSAPAPAPTAGMDQGGSTFLSYDLQPQLSNQFQLGFDTCPQQSGTNFLNDYTSLLPYQDLLHREVKVEGESNVIEPWQIPYMMNPLETLAGSGEPSYSYWNNSTAVTSWTDVKNSSSIASQYCS